MRLHKEDAHSMTLTKCTSAGSGTPKSDKLAPAKSQKPLRIYVVSSVGWTARKVGCLGDISV